jgi:hypothetical protein
MIFQLIEKCIQEARQSPDSPKFRLVLELDAQDGLHAGVPANSVGGTMSFQEVNPFRHLCHLSLKVCKGTDAQVTSSVYVYYRKD